MRTRTRYKLERVDVTAQDSHVASWTFAGEAIRGTEHAYAAVDRNVRAPNLWEFVVRVPDGRGARVEVRPRRTPALAAYAELPDRSLTFMPATKSAARGKWYCQVALADATGERSKAVVRTDRRAELPHWFKSVASAMRRKEAVRPTRGTDADALVVLVAAGDHAAMIRLFFATKVWVLREGFTLARA